MTAAATVEEACRLIGPRARHDVPIGSLTTYRVGGAADIFLEADGLEDLHAARAAVMSTGIPVLVLGKGSNLLVSDAGFRGLALVLGVGFAEIEIVGTRVRAGAATGLPVLARRTAAAALTGLEWAVGVPGSVGGAVRMNAGGHGSDMAHCLTGCHLFDLAAETEGDRSVPSLDYRYRHSSLGPTDVVTSGSFDLQRGDRAVCEAQITDIVRWRREHQPGGQNAGSVFTNPVGDSAGRLVEAAGLKGFRVGSAVVSSKHANFIQADPSGSADDVRRLIDMVQDTVRRETGVELVPELRMVGFA